MNNSNSISQPKGKKTAQIGSLVVGGIGLLILFLSLMNIFGGQSYLLYLSLITIFVGIVWYSISKYNGLPDGIKNNGIWFEGISSRKILGIIVGIVLTGFYVLLYWYPAMLGLGKDGGSNSSLVEFFDPLSMFLKDKAASQWFVYGVLYTLAILGFGIKFIMKYRHNKYQQLRTISVMFFQLGFAFLLPEFLMRLNQPYYNFANMWPLNYYFFDEWHIKGMLNADTLGMFMLIFGLAMVFLISPFLTYKYGKRWYCSWVCGCGGLAETAGDSFRQLSSKKMSTWKFERWSIHIILVLSFIMTIAVVSTYLSDNVESIISRNQFLYGAIGFLTLLVGVIYLFKRQHLNNDAKVAMLAISVLIGLIIILMITSNSNNIFGLAPHQLRAWYGFAIGSAFSGVIGVGFYPILGSRVWCRFGCPMAGILGIQQRLLSKFRITTNGGQCISCGNCSTYCEMGIDVRSYAQKGQNIVRASCVGCGVCSAVCPRGVLRLENGSVDIDLRADI